MYDVTKIVTSFDLIGAQYVALRFSDGTTKKDTVACKAITMWLALEDADGVKHGGWWVCNDNNDGYPLYRFESRIVAIDFAVTANTAWDRLTGH